LLDKIHLKNVLLHNDIQLIAHVKLFVELIDPKN